MTVIYFWIVLVCQCLSLFQSNCLFCCHLFFFFLLVYLFFCLLTALELSSAHQGTDQETWVSSPFLVQAAQRFDFSFGDLTKLFRLGDSWQSNGSQALILFTSTLLRLSLTQFQRLVPQLKWVFNVGLRCVSWEKNSGERKTLKKRSIHFLAPTGALIVMMC